MEMIGNDSLINHIQAIAASKRVANTYMICGEEGTGKMIAARFFAKTLLCSGDRKPCDMCMSCIQAEAGSHPDIIYVKPEKPGSLRVDDIRAQINETVHIKPYYGPYKVYIVNEAETMNVQAQNALLKTLEEPPEYVVILLVSNSAEIFLQTIRSRSVILNVRPLTNERVREYLLAKGFEGRKAAAIAGISGGSIGKAIQMAESEEFMEMTEGLHEFLKKLPEETGQDASDLAAFLASHKVYVEEALDYMRLWYRDMTVVRMGGGREVLLFADDAGTLKKITAKMRLSAVDRVMNAIGLAHDRMGANVNLETTLELLALDMLDSVR